MTSSSDEKNRNSSSRLHRGSFYQSMPILKLTSFNEEEVPPTGVAFNWDDSHHLEGEENPPTST